MNTRLDREGVSRTAFLKDVLICSLGAYGGPEAHYGVFTDQLVIKKGYLSEEDLIELIALTGILPGPSSTQTLVAIGYKMGGPLLALLTMLVWATPVLIIMAALSFTGQFLDGLHVSHDILRYVGPMAVGFIAVAAYRIGRKVIRDGMTLVLFLLGAGITYVIRAPWIFPAVLLAGGFLRMTASKEKDLWQHGPICPPWGYLMAFAGFAAGSLILSMSTNHLIVDLFESFYRYGYLVIGGGQVVVPLMYSELVEIDQYMTGPEFLTGFGLVQGLPGPMFSFSAYAGGMAARGQGTLVQILGAMAGGVAIFLPGLLLIFFVYPVWEQLRKIRGIKVSLSGVTAVAGGLITSAAIVLMQRSGFQPDNLLILAATALLLLSKKIPSPLIVVMVLAAGIFL